MKKRIGSLSRLASLRESKVRQMLGRVQYQQNLCQRYRNNIAGLGRLCEFTVSMSTPLQRDNQQRYKGTLFKMMELQRRELAVAEAALARIQRELMKAMRSEKVVTHVLETKMEEWQQWLAQQEQKIQDGLAAQSWWRNQGL
jgi:flagellar export protein FliJ